MTESGACSVVEILNFEIIFINFRSLASSVGIFINFRSLASSVGGSLLAPFSSCDYCFKCRAIVFSAEELFLVQNHCLFSRAIVSDKRGIVLRIMS